MAPIAGDGLIGRQGGESGGLGAQHPEPKPDPRLETPMGRDRVEPAMNQGARESVAPVSEPRPIAILKSGVIDGMAYTLYTDGSIEAELPQGTMRFASIDELRAHLEQAERSE